jgi:hypothetical protein
MFGEGLLLPKREVELRGRGTVETAGARVRNDANDLNLRLQASRLIDPRAVGFV